MQTPDLFRSRIDAMIKLNDPLPVLAQRLPWDLIEAAVAAKFERQSRTGQSLDGADLFGPTAVVVGGGIGIGGRPRLPIRLMASLVYLKNCLNLSDEELCARWSENVLWQSFSGLDYYEHRLPCDPTQIGRFRRALGEDGLEELLKATIDTAVAIKAVKTAELERVIVDTTVQEKTIAHPVDSRLLEIAHHHKVISAAKRAGVQLKQTLAKEGKELRRRAGGYAHAKQFRRLKKVVKRQRTTLGIVMREVRRKLEAPAFAALNAKALSDLTMWLGRAERIRTQQTKDKNKLHALHAPEVECIGKGKARKPYEFGVKAAIVVSHKAGLMMGRSFASFEDLNTQALRWCIEVANAKPKRALGMSAEAACVMEKPHVGKLPAVLPAVYEVFDRVVDLYGFVSVDTNRYSVPERLVGKTVTVYKHHERIEIHYRRMSVASHPRLIGVRDARHTLSGHHTVAQRAPRQPSVQAQLLCGQHATLDAYVSALAAHLSGRGTRALNRLLQIKRSYPPPAGAARAHSTGCCSSSGPTRRSRSWPLWSRR